MKEKVIVIGAGHLGQIIAYHLLSAGAYDFMGYLDDTFAPGHQIGTHKVLGSLEVFKQLFEQKVFDKFLIGIGYHHMRAREFLFGKLSLVAPAATFVHPDAYIDPSAIIGSGVFIHPGCTLDMNVTIQDNVILNTSCTIAHDSIIASHSFLAPRVAVAGFCRIGKRCMLGINTTIIDNIELTDDVQTGGGCVITKNILQSGLYVGVPGRYVK